MTVSGSPPWNRTMVWQDYGGDPEKRNYNGRGVVDPRTDIDAGQVQRMAADMACACRTMPFAVLHVTPNGTSTPVVTSAIVGPVPAPASYTGNTPPSGMPTVARSSAGSYGHTFPSPYVDPAGSSAEFTPRIPSATVVGTNAYVASAVVSGGRVNVYVRDASTGALVDSVAYVLEVW